MRQAEFSRTQIFDRPPSGRLFFEQMPRDNLDLGRPKPKACTQDWPPFSRP